MDHKKIGEFIAKLRKEKNMTQSELAEKLGISDRSVSKWERGLNLPDTNIMTELCSILGITINDLFNGEIVEKDNGQKNKFNKKIMIFILLLLIIIFGLGLLFSYKFFSDKNDNDTLVNEKLDSNKKNDKNINDDKDDVSNNEKIDEKIEDEKVDEKKEESKKEESSKKNNQSSTNKVVNSNKNNKNKTDKKEEVKKDETKNEETITTKDDNPNEELLKDRYINLKCSYYESVIDQSTFGATTIDVYTYVDATFDKVDNYLLQKIKYTYSYDFSKDYEEMSDEDLKYNEQLLIDEIGEIPGFNLSNRNSKNNIIKFSYSATKNSLLKIYPNEFKDVYSEFGYLGFMNNSLNGYLCEGDVQVNH